MSGEQLAYLIFSTTMAVVLWLALALLAAACRRRRDWRRWLGLAVVVGNSALFWTAAAALRAAGASAPGVMNMWSRVVYALFAFYALGTAYALWRHDG